MNEPAPRKRFAFSLRFLLAWVLLAGLLLGATFTIKDSPRPRPDEKKGSILIFYGWPCANYTEQYTWDHSIQHETRTTDRRVTGIALNTVIYAVLALILCRIFTGLMKPKDEA